MLKIVSCLAYEHDLSFVFVAAIVCIAGSAMTMRLYERARRLSGSSRTLWVVFSGAAGGTAIWTTHFVAMLGFRPPTGYAYQPLLTLASLALAMAFTAAGLYIATRPRGAVLGGSVLGLGISIMHFTGMAALEVAGHIEWDGFLVAVAVVFGMLFGILATSRGDRLASASGQMVGAAALVLAIWSMHFTAMAAASFVPDPSIVVSPGGFSSDLLAMAVVATLSIVAGLALYVLDARAQREMLEGFRHAALHDPLTGMPNRAFLSARLSAMLENGARTGCKVAVVMIDLDRFKDINDVHGHSAGDHLLQRLAERLKAATGLDEFVARVGGDEFIAVKENIRAPDDALEFGERLISRITVPLMREDRTLSVGASLGISLYPNHARTAEELIGVADLAMYRAKKQMGRKICFYDQSMDEGRRVKSALAMELRGAIERDEFLLHYQPQIDVGSREIKGFEALLRWNHPRRGLVAPGEFIPIAEEAGLIIQIGEWVLRTACADAVRWRKPLKLAVNIAAAQLTQTAFPQLVRTILDETGLAPTRLELEVTEASIIDDMQGTLSAMRRLRASGITIVMDDYGTGYSSLSTLQIFPFDKIKIDRSFVDEVLTNRASAAIVKATILLAKSLDMLVLAEGVERQEQLDFLRAEGCAEAQGYLFGRPQPGVPPAWAARHAAAEVLGGLRDSLPSAEVQPMRAGAG